MPFTKVFGTESEPPLAVSSVAMSVKFWFTWPALATVPLLKVCVTVKAAIAVSEDSTRNMATPVAPPFSVPRFKKRMLTPSNRSASRPSPHAGSVAPEGAPAPHTMVPQFWPHTAKASLGHKATNKAANKTTQPPRPLDMVFSLILSPFFVKLNAPDP